MQKIPIRNNKRLLNQDGQAALEFILTFAFGLGITFLFVNFTINYTVGYAVHYATFMSSRVFETYDESNQTIPANLLAAERVAKDTFNGYQLDRFGIESSGVTVYRPGPGGNAANSLFVGVTTQFQKKMSSLSFVGGQQEVTFLSESFLGKEPLRIECYTQVCRAMGEGQCDRSMMVTLYDNGC